MAKKNRYSRQSQRYIEKKRSQKITEMPLKMSREEFEYNKHLLMATQEEANRRIELIQSQGFTSHALERVIAEGYGRDYFDISEINNAGDLIAETTRMRVFINDHGSTLDGAKLDTAQIASEKYKGKFGNQYNNKEHDFAKFDTSVIDRVIAMKAFEAYRKIEESRAAQITQKGGYGSENLIIALYDAEVRGLDSEGYGNSLLNKFFRQDDEEQREMQEKMDSVTGITGVIIDNLRGRYIC